MSYCNAVKKDVDEYIKEMFNYLDKQLNEIKKEPKKFYIVNAGRMNHGKSSLFNSLLDKEVFSTGDIRTTIQVSEAEFQPHVFLVDTPGLDAEKSDDKVAFNAYKKANMVIFVHTLNVGELHKDEIERINQIKDLFPTSRYFWKHFCLALTFTEAVEENDLKEIEIKILNDIQTQCGGTNFPVFHISNKRYMKGKDEGKEALIKHSGIEDMRTCLMSRKLSQWCREAQGLAEDRKKALLEETLGRLNRIKKSFEQECDTKHNKIKIKKENTLDNIYRAFAEIEDYQEYLQDSLQIAKNLEQQVNQLEQRHRQERSYY